MTRNKSQGQTIDNDVTLRQAVFARSPSPQIEFGLRIYILKCNGQGNLPKMKEFLQKTSSMQKFLSNKIIFTLF